MWIVAVWGAKRLQCEIDLGSGGLEWNTGWGFSLYKCMRGLDVFQECEIRNSIRPPKVDKTSVLDATVTSQPFSLLPVSRCRRSHGNIWVVVVSTKQIRSKSKTFILDFASSFQIKEVNACFLLRRTFSSSD